MFANQRLFTSSVHLFVLKIRLFLFEHIFSLTVGNFQRECDKPQSFLTVCPNKITVRMWTDFIFGNEKAQCNRKVQRIDGYSFVNESVSALSVFPNRKKKSIIFASYE